MEPIQLVVGIVATVVAIFFGYHEYRRSQRKKLGWEIVTAAPLFSLRKEARGKIEVLYSGHTIQDAHLVQVSIKNQGRRDIVPNDFIDSNEPLRINFMGSGRVLEILETDRSSPKLEFSLLGPLSNTPQLTIDKLFLQKGEWFSLRVIVSEYEGVEIITRIADCDLLKLEPGPPLRALRIFLRMPYYVFLGIVLSILTTVFIAVKQLGKDETISILTAGFLGFSIMVGLGFMLDFLLYLNRRIGQLSSPEKTDHHESD